VLNTGPASPFYFAVLKARVLFGYHANNEDELTLQEGEIITVLDREIEDGGWWLGEIHGKKGVFPDNFVELLQEEVSIKFVSRELPTAISSF
jgi:hypothetical protein